MERLTSDMGSIADAKEVTARLKKYEDLHEELIREQEIIIKEMANLKADGKEKTLKYRELFAKKLQNIYVLNLFNSHGL